MTMPVPYRHSLRLVGLCPAVLVFIGYAGCSRDCGEVNLTMQAPNDGYKPFDGRTLGMPGIGGGLTTRGGHQYYIFVGQHKPRFCLCKRLPILTVVLAIPISKRGSDEHQVQITGYVFGTFGGPEIRLDGLCTMVSGAGGSISFRGTLRPVEVFYVPQRNGQGKDVLVKRGVPTRWPWGHLVGRVVIGKEGGIPECDVADLLGRYWLILDDRGTLMLDVNEPLGRTELPEFLGGTREDAPLEPPRIDDLWTD